MLRRLLVAALAAAVFASLVGAPAAFADALTPESGGSQNADDIDTLYKLTFYIGIVIFLLVWGTLLWSLVRHRARRGGRAEQIRGNTPLEIGWTVGAALILVVLTVITFMYLGDIENPERTSAEGLQFATVDQPAPPGDKALEIDVNGQQYLWRYDYPGDPRTFSYHELVVPVNTTVVLKITGSDVIHSWWVPKLGGKMDGVPGHTNETWFKISKPGNYEGVCAELCGEGHAEMRTRVRALPVAEYERWREGQAAGIARSQEILPAQRVARESGEQTPARPSETDTSEEQQ
jgi:cytochrome c oxidase subunit II